MWEQLDDEHAVPELVASYDEVVRLVSRSGLMQRHYVVVRWSLTPTFLAAAARRGPAQAGWRALMRSKIESVRSHLFTAKLGEVAPVSAAQLAAVLAHRPGRRRGRERPLAAVPRRAVRDDHQRRRAGRRGRAVVAPHRAAARQVRLGW